MTKKQNLKKQVGGVKKERIALWAIIFTLIVLQAISAWYLMNLRSDVVQTSERNLYTLINNSEEGRYKYPVIDITEGRVYIPEARVYLPLNDTTRDLRYDYFAVQDYKSLRLSTSAIVGSQHERDHHSCDKVIILSLSKEPTNTAYYDAGEIQPTRDGLRYLSVHNKDTCSIYYGSVQEDLAQAAKSITRY
jgi:hypothetical protein